MGCSLSCATGLHHLPVGRTSTSFVRGVSLRPCQGQKTQSFWLLTSVDLSCCDLAGFSTTHEARPSSRVPQHKIAHSAHIAGTCGNDQPREMATVPMCCCSCKSQYACDLVGVGQVWQRWPKTAQGGGRNLCFSSTGKLSTRASWVLATKIKPVSTALKATPDRPTRCWECWRLLRSRPDDGTSSR